MANVTDFFRNVVPQVVGSLPAAAPAPAAAVSDRDRPLWVSFEESGVVEDAAPQRLPPFLVVGYASSVQVWGIRDPMKFLEVVSMRTNGPASCGKILAAPHASLGTDAYAGSRPLLAYADAEKPSMLQLFSLRHQSADGAVDARAPVLNVASNSRVVAIGLRDRIRLVSPAGLDQLLAEVPGCSLSGPGSLPNPFALGSRWLAHCTMLPAPELGGAEPSSTSMATVVEIAQKTGSSLLTLGGMGVKKVSDMVNGAPPAPAPVPEPRGGPSADAAGVPAASDDMAGNVCLLDVRQPARKLCHFRAATRVPIVALAFDATGTLLASACARGQDIQIFHLGLTPAAPSLDARREGVLIPAHIYTLHRGVTMANIRSISFSIDSRWAAVTSDRSTTHLFPLLPRGGAMTPRTHTSSTVTNSSRFRITSGANEYDATDRAPVVVDSVAKIKHPLQAGPEPPMGPSMLCSSDCRFGSFGLGEPGDGKGQQPSGSPQYTLLLCAPSAELFEYKLSPHTVSAPRSALMGMMPSSASSAASGVMTTVSSVWGGMRGVVANVVGNPRLGESPPNSLAPPLAPQPAIEVLNMSCMAARAWDVCRRTSWLPTKKTARKQAKDKAPAHALPARATSIDTASESAWLSQVETGPYNPPHRRLWMGPQFSFRLFQPREVSSGAFVASSPPGPTDIYSRDLCLLSQPLFERREPIPIPNPASEGSTPSSSWNDAPIARGLDTLQQELSAALGDEDSDVATHKETTPTRKRPPASRAPSTSTSSTSSAAPSSRAPTTPALQPAAASAAAPLARASPPSQRRPPALSDPARLSSLPATTSTPISASPLFAQGISRTLNPAPPARATTLPSPPTPPHTSARTVPTPPSALKPQSPSQLPSARALGASAPTSFAKSASMGSSSKGSAGPSFAAQARSSLPRVEATDARLPPMAVASPKGRGMFVMGASPSPEEATAGPLFAARANAGLAAILGDADSGQAMMRVHSAVSLNGLAEAQRSDEEADTTLFAMDDHDHEHVD